MIAKKNYKNILLLALFFKISIFGRDLTLQDVTQNSTERLAQAAEQSSIKDDIGEVIDFEKIEKELQKELEKEGGDSNENGSEDFFVNIQNPIQLLERLPKETQQAVLNAFEEGKNLYAMSQHPTIFLLDIIQNVEDKIEEFFIKGQGQSKELVSKLRISLLSVQRLLSSKDFQIFVLFGNQSLKIEIEFKEILDELEERLIELKDCDVAEKNFLYENVEIIKDSISAVVANNDKLLVAARGKYLKELSAKTFLILDKAKDELNKLKKGLKKDADKELEEAITFWQQTLKNIEGLKPSKLSKVLSVGGQAASYIEGGYFFYRKFMELYRFDNPIVWTNPLSLLGFLGDQAFRVSMIPLHFLKRLSDLSQAGIDPQLAQAELKQITMECVGIYLNPNFCVRSMAWPLRSFYRIYPTVVYKSFHDFNKDSFNFQNFLPELKRIFKSFPDDEKFRRAIWFSMKDGYQTLASNLELMIVRGIKSETLNKLESSSLGILKPNLISFTLNTAMPLLGLSDFCKKHFLNFQKKDIFANEFSTLKDVMVNVVGDAYYVGRKDFPDNAYFIEGRIWGYLASSLGSYFGKELVRLNKRPIKFVSSKIIKGCSVVFSKLGIIEDADWQDTLLNNIRELVKDMINTNPAMIILVRQGLFPMLAGLGIMTQLEVAKLEDEFNAGIIDDKTIEFVVDKIFSSIVDTVLVGVGGLVGSYVAWLSANKLMKEHGPFWPTIKNEVCEVWSAATYGFQNLREHFA